MQGLMGNAGAGIQQSQINASDGNSTLMSAPTAVRDPELQLLPHWERVISQFVLPDTFKELAVSVCKQTISL